MESEYGHIHSSLSKMALSTLFEIKLPEDSLEMEVQLLFWEPDLSCVLDSLAMLLSSKEKSCSILGGGATNTTSLASLKF